MPGFTDIAMSRAIMPSGMRTWLTKVNFLLYMCLSTILEDGILLDTPSLCTFRFELNVTQAKEEVKHKRAPTPSKREA